MKNLALAFVLFAACSKSSAKPSATTEQKPVVVEPATDDGITPCDEACTSYAQCYEQVYKGESFRGGGGCVDTCEKQSAAEQVAYAKEMAEAVRNNECAKLMHDDGEESAEDDDEAGMADGEPAVALPAGRYKFGCVGWSTQLRTAACIVGEAGTDGEHKRLMFIGDDTIAPVPLVDGDASVRAKANETLDQQGFSALKSAASSLRNRVPKTINGAALRFTTIETPESNHYMVVAATNGRTVTVFETEGEGLTTSVKARPVGFNDVLVEVLMHTAREGEVNDNMVVLLLDGGSGEVTR